MIGTRPNDLTIVPGLRSWRRDETRAAGRARSDRNAQNRQDVGPGTDPSRLSTPPRIECEGRASQDLTRAQVGVGSQRSGPDFSPRFVARSVAGPSGARGALATLATSDGGEGALAMARAMRAIWTVVSLSLMVCAAGLAGAFSSKYIISMVRARLVNAG